MSSSGSWPVLVLHPEPSRILAALLVAVHLAALLAVLAMGFPWPVTALSCAGLGANLVMTLRRYVLFRVRTGIRGARWNPDGSWAVWGGDGLPREAILHSGSMATRQVSVLNFKCPGARTESLVLLRDAVETQTMRRLVARFRLAGSHKR
ncbi:MAG: protein YgfX [Pseudomonadota bacterium]|nr:protein YgfX [Pseudomonadota bacterium]